jgi:hypothetical protein
MRFMPRLKAVTDDAEILKERLATAPDVYINKIIFGLL